MSVKNAVVFSGRNGLDFFGLRTGVIRIPDVTIRIREAQQILDSMDIPKFDLLSTIAADDEFFFRNIKLKSLASAIVQIGLFDRYLKTQKYPDVMVGNSNGDSAMMVCSGQMSFRELIESSQALDTMRPAVEKVVALQPAVSAPLLSGLSLTEYQAMQNVGTSIEIKYESIPGGSMELRKLIQSLFENQGVSRFVNIGPGSALLGSDYRNLANGEIESSDSIELDPMLGWFWRNVGHQAFALAQ